MKYLPRSTRPDHAIAVVPTAVDLGGGTAAYFSCAIRPRETAVSAVPQRRKKKPEDRQQRTIEARWCVSEDSGRVPFQGKAGDIACVSVRQDGFFTASSGTCRGLTKAFPAIQRMKELTIRHLLVPWPCAGYRLRSLGARPRCRQMAEAANGIALIAQRVRHLGGHKTQLDGHRRNASAYADGTTSPCKSTVGKSVAASSAWRRYGRD